MHRSRAPSALPNGLSECRNELDDRRPPPPPSFFVEGFLVTPGILAGCPFILAGLLFGVDWLTQLGLILGAAVFWYCAGWQLDAAQTNVRSDDPPTLVRWYLMGVRVLSLIVLPFGLLAGFNLGVHYCANGVPPYWVELLSYAVLMVWVTLGTFFTWLRFKRTGAKNTRPSSGRVLKA